MRQLASSINDIEERETEMERKKVENQQAARQKKLPRMLAELYIDMAH